MINRKQLFDAIELIQQLINQINQAIDYALKQAEEEGITQLIRTSLNKNEIKVLIQIDTEKQEDGQVRKKARRDMDVITFFTGKVLEGFFPKIKNNPEILRSLLAIVEKFGDTDDISHLGIITFPVGFNVTLERLCSQALSDNADIQMSKDDSAFVSLKLIKDEIKKFNNSYDAEKAELILRKFFEIIDKYPDYHSEINWEDILIQIGNLGVKNRNGIDEIVKLDLEFHLARVRLLISNPNISIDDEQEIVSLKRLEYANIYQFDDQTKLDNASKDIQSLLDRILAKPDLAIHVDWKRVLDKINKLSTTNDDKILNENKTYIRCLKNFLELQEEIKAFDSKTEHHIIIAKTNRFLDFLETRDNEYIVYADLNAVSDQLRKLVKDLDDDEPLRQSVRYYLVRIERCHTLKNDESFKLALSNLYKCLHKEDIDPMLKQCGILFYKAAHGGKSVIPQKYIPQLTCSVQGVADAINDKKKSFKHYKNTQVAIDLNLGTRQSDRIKFAAIAVSGALLCAAAIAVGVIFLPAGIAGLVLGLTIAAVGISLLLGVGVTVKASIEAEKANKGSLIPAMEKVGMELKKK